MDSNTFKMSEYRRNHYVPKWYQRRFLQKDARENKFYYLDLTPDSNISGGCRYKRKALLRWGPPKCFCEKDLYTTKLREWASTEIEEKFFGKVDGFSGPSVDYFSNFEHPSVSKKSFHNLILYMSIQKLRTPKGLASLSDLVNLSDKNLVLLKLQELQQLFCAIWAECVWCIVDASESNTKFILSDHPVTVYNQACFPASKWCRGYRDPDIRFSATHTLFPLNLNKMLILTNLSWVRNPYGGPKKTRPNPQLFRPTIFNFTDIQTGRSLTEVKVTEINFVIKKRAYRYIAAAEKEWLYPENKISTLWWDKLGNGYLFMPDPRSVTFSTEILMGDGSGRSDAFDEYGRKPWHSDYRDETQREKEWETFQAFKGEFARVFGPRRRGRSFEGMHLSNEEDSPDFHSYHLGLEQKNRKFKVKRKKKKRR